MGEHAHDVLLPRRQVLPYGVAGRGVGGSKRWCRSRGHQRSQPRQVGPPGHQGHRHEGYPGLRRSVQDRAIAGLCQEVGGCIEMPEPVVVVAVERRGAGERQSQDARTAGQTQVDLHAFLFQPGQQVTPESPGPGCLLLIGNGDQGSPGNQRLPGSQRRAGNLAPAGQHRHVAELQRLTNCNDRRQTRRELAQRPSHPRLVGRHVQYQQARDMMPGREQPIKGEGDNLRPGRPASPARPMWTSHLLSGALPSTTLRDDYDLHRI